MPALKIHIDPALCIGCGQCSQVCAAHNIQIKDGHAQLLLENCMQCGQCSAICPKEAISMQGIGNEPVKKKKAVSLDPNQILEVLQFRRTIRHFQKKNVPQAVVEQILKAGVLTHTAKNAQDVSYIVLDKQKDTVEQMAVQLFQRVKPWVDLCSPMARNTPITKHFFFFEAPLVIVILAKDKTNGILAAQNMEYVAEANQLGVLFSGFFTMAANHSRRIRKTLAIPKGKKVAMTLVMGYPKMNFLRSVKRKPIDVHYL